MSTGCLELHVLRSGDRGVCMVVRDAVSSDALAIDCGISAETFLRACRQCGLDPFGVRAILITHGHANQVKGLRSLLAWLAKYEVRPSVYVAQPVFEQTPALRELGAMVDIRYFKSKEPFEVGSITVRPFRTFHNNEDKGGCYNFRFEAQFFEMQSLEAQSCDVRPSMSHTVHAEPVSDAIVVLSDAGVLSREAQGELSGVRVLGIETNYDAAMLREAQEHDKNIRFVVDTRGNFSNAQAGAVVRRYAHPSLQAVVALYPSRRYNSPGRIAEEIHAALDACGSCARLRCADPDTCVSIVPEVFDPSALVELETARKAGYVSARELLQMWTRQGKLGASDVDISSEDAVETYCVQRGLIEVGDGLPTGAAFDAGALGAYYVDPDSPDSSSTCVGTSGSAQNRLKTLSVFPATAAEELWRLG